MRLETGWVRSKPPTQPIELQLIDKILHPLIIILSKNKGFVQGRMSKSFSPIKTKRFKKLKEKELGNIVQKDTVVGSWALKDQKFLAWGHK